MDASVPTRICVPIRPGQDFIAEDPEEVVRSVHADPPTD